jgi:AcrR family transcriptional regulator
LERDAPTPPNDTTRHNDPTPPLDARAARSHARGLSAARSILLDEGLSRLTHARVAEVSGLLRATVYRHWPTAISLLIAVTRDETASALPAPSGDLPADLFATLRTLRDELAGGFGRFLASLMDSAEHDRDLSEAKFRITAEGMASLRLSLEEGMQRRELAADLDLELSVSQLFGPVLYRRFLSREPMSDDLLVQVVDAFLRIHRRVPQGHS